MKKLVALIFATLPAITFSQSLFETFDNNDRGWHIESNVYCKREISGGKYVLRTFPKAPGEITYVPSYFDIDKDFTLEATFVQRAGTNESGMGLIWGLARSTVFNEFVINSKGHYKVAPFGKGNWTATSLVRPPNEENTLRLEKRGERVSCYINNEFATAGTLPARGFFAGFIGYADLTVEVDNISFDQANEINLAPDTLKAAKENLGAHVNTVFEEVDPNISADGRSLYFVRKHDTHNIGGAQDKGDIWVSDWVNGQWSQARNLGRPINSARPDNLTAVTADNNRIILNRGLGMFFFSKRHARGWSRPEELGLGFPAMSWHIESSLSADGKTILAALRTASNVHFDKEIHETDIYVSRQDEKGTWSSFVNLGPTINTVGEELSPFLSPDGRTLYFASAGHPGYGGGDIFVSRRIGDGWTNWTLPVNLGPRINTRGFDAYYTVPACGDYAYMVSSADAIGRTDIVRIKLHPAVMPDPVVLVFGKTINAKTKKPMSAEILLDNLGSGREVARVISDPQTGAFKIVLPPGANYGLHAAAKGFLSVNENLELITINSCEEREKNLLLVPIEVGESIQLNNVFFEQGKAILRTESVPELDRLVEILKENRTLEIELSGYTDSMGSADALQRLSEDRVAAVIDYLVAHGVNKHRLRGQGYGSENPRALNDTEEHRKMNRRVEFRIVKN